MCVCEIISQDWWFLKIGASHYIQNMLIVFGSAKVPINLKFQSNSIRIRLLHKLRVPHLRTLNIHQYSAKHPPANPFILFYSKIVMKTPAFVHALLHWTLWFWRSPSHQNVTSITKDETQVVIFLETFWNTLSRKQPKTALFANTPVGQACTHAFELLMT